MSKAIFKAMRIECEHKVKEILMRYNGSVELEMTKNVLLRNGRIIQPQTIFLFNDRIGIVDGYDIIYSIDDSNAIFDALELLELYVNDMEEDIRINIALG